ncbi:MAG: bifunctional methionine sulfoxide reductase B/A protein [Phycisphaerales bacterium]|nr:bifunctional methionine sulfoxide reductase B/A protein [Phycisphaerales bacterium]
MKSTTPSKPSDAPSGPRYSKSGYDITPLTEAGVEELARKLTPEQREIMLAKGTERAFCEKTLHDNKKAGTYVCRLCALPLFSSDAKFDSGTGWPSFYQPVDKDHVRYKQDESHGMLRTEIMCNRCGGHLGHVFEDGPRPTGLRFCLNSASLEFFEKKDGKIELPAAAQPVKVQAAYFAGGCFWGVEDRFQQLPGVIDAVSGYMGGKSKDPTYKQVCNGDTEHAETVRIVFDPAKISYRQLLEKFFKFHDPTQLNRQGPDFGDQYRSAIFTVGSEQAAAAKSFIEEQAKTDRFKGRKIETEVRDAQKAGKFYEAEEYHQDYHLKHGGHCPMPGE